MEGVFVVISLFFPGADIRSYSVLMYFFFKVKDAFLNANIKYFCTGFMELAIHSFAFFNSVMTNIQAI